MKLTGKKFNPIARNDADDGYKSMVLDGSDAVLYRTATASGRYMPAKFAEKSRGYGISCMSDRVEFQMTTNDGEPVQVAISHDLIQQLARFIEERTA